MAQFNFYDKKELKDAKKERREPLPIFGIRSSVKSIGLYIKRYDLEGTFVWREVYD